MGQDNTPHVKVHENGTMVSGVAPGPSIRFPCKRPFGPLPSHRLFIEARTGPCASSLHQVSPSASLPSFQNRAPGEHITD